MQLFYLWQVYPLILYGFTCKNYNDHTEYTDIDFLYKINTSNVILATEKALLDTEMVSNP